MGRLVARAATPSPRAEEALPNGLTLYMQCKKYFMKLCKVWRSIRSWQHLTVCQSEVHSVLQTMHRRLVQMPFPKVNPAGGGASFACIEGIHAPAPEQKMSPESLVCSSEQSSIEPHRVPARPPSICPPPTDDVSPISMIAF